MTFSISARCPRTGEMGIAVSSSSPAVAARCAHARAGAGVVATQNITDPTLGPKGLDLLACGLSAAEALARLRAEAPHIEYRQLALVDRGGGTAAFSGSRTLGVHATVEGPGAVAAGNLLRAPNVPEAMVAAFLAAPEQPLAARLLAAMRAAVAAGGEAGPVHSAGLLLVRDVAWPIADLRVDWHDTDPIAALADLWALWAPQMDAYVTRALNPASAPAYGVPGDLPAGDGAG
jgi:uncharacterized Ntn-hydrolase superfamily protein